MTASEPGMTALEPGMTASESGMTNWSLPPIYFCLSLQASIVIADLIRNPCRLKTKRIPQQVVLVFNCAA